VRRFSAPGEYGAVWLAIAGAGTVLDSTRARRWRRAGAAVGAAYVLNTLLKLVVRRRRPVMEGLPALVRTPTDLSFPSAHATTSFAAARAFTPLLPAPLRAPLYALASAMALSRLYLGVHHPSDVAAGAVLGSAVGAMAR
jgi:undecaprenyl-diphosphatase